MRPNRYALARSTAQPLSAAVLALHECDVPLCVKVANPAFPRQHVVAGTQRDNMIRMAYTGRGGGLARGSAGWFACTVGAFGRYAKR